MALTILDQNSIASLLTAMWKKELNTGEDPSNSGRWNTNGANNDGVGLYGGLTDSIDSAPTFDLANKNYSPTQRLAASSTVDNRNGLAGSTSVTLSYSYANSVSTTHTVSRALKVGLGIDFKVSAEFFGVGTDVTTKFSIDYTYSSSDASSTTQTRTQTVSQQVQVNPPTGKVYKAVLVGSAQQIDVPYHLNVHVSGRTETWFENRVNGHYNWAIDIGTAFSIAGNPQYMRDSATGQGLVTGVTGMLTAQQTTGFVVQTWDVTASTPPSHAEMPQKFAVVRDGQFLPEGAILISSTPVGEKAFGKAV